MLCSDFEFEAGVGYSKFDLLTIRVLIVHRPSCEVSLNHCEMFIRSMSTAVQFISQT